MSRPYPWKCPDCKAKAVQPAVIEHCAQVKHENVLHDVYVRELPVHQCGECGAVIVGEDADEIIRAALRDKLRLLTPNKILACRKDLEYTQSVLADLCGFAAESLSRWENGGLQSRSSDRLMRLVFGVPEARAFLADLLVTPTLGEQVIWGEFKASEYPLYCPIGTTSIPNYCGILTPTSSSSIAAAEPVPSVEPERNKDPPVFTRKRCVPHCQHEQESTQNGRSRYNFQYGSGRPLKGLAAHQVAAIDYPARRQLRFAAGYRSPPVPR